MIIFIMLKYYSLRLVAGGIFGILLFYNTRIREKRQNILNILSCTENTNKNIW